MSESKHTPGPWKVATGGPNGCPIVHTDAGVMLAMVACGESHPSNENARVMAAAPELLASLEAVLPLVKYTNDAGWDVMKKARAIVDNANGR